MTVDGVEGDLAADQPAAEADHVGVVVLAGEAGGGDVVHDRGPDTGDLVGGERVPRAGPAADGGLLGAALSRTAEGWRIERVLPSESSDPGARSPLRAAGVDARPGDLIVAVDGRPVDPVAGPAAALRCRS